MRRKVGIIKRIFSLLLVFLFSINSFAAVVSDNDGSAFISKAEFDSLKNSFQSQIDSYNTSIDSKIDGAIASYLAGIRLSPEWNIVTKQAKFLNTWQYKTPQSNYQLDLTTSLVTYGVSGMASGGGQDFAWPSSSTFVGGSNPVDDKIQTTYLNYDAKSRTSSTQFTWGIAFEIVQCAVSKTNLEAVMQNFGNCSASELYSYCNLTSPVDAHYAGLLNKIGLPRQLFQSITIHFWSMQTYSSGTKKKFTDFTTWTISGEYSPGGGGPAFARNLNENNTIKTPTATDTNSVQVANESGKLFIDSKPYTSLKIENQVNVNCFHYQDKSSSYTTSSAFGDSSFSGVTVGNIPEHWEWNTKKTFGTTINKTTATTTGTTNANAYGSVQNFLSFEKASSQVLKNTTWGSPGYTTNVVTVDDGLILDNNGSTSTTTTTNSYWTGTGKYVSGSTLTTSNVTLYYPKVKLPLYTFKQYTQQIYDYYSNDFTDKEGNPIKWGEGIRIAECKAERGSSRIFITYHIENMSGTAVASQPCIFELSTKKFVKCVAESGTSMGTQTVTPASSATNTVTFDIGATGENAELWLNAYCSSNNYTVVIDSIAAE